ncbi:MAG: 4-hydroxy-tetrahydrodipicolinate synthase [Actinomycetota bacterium]
MTGRFGSIVTAMVTPFRDDFSLDLDAAQTLGRHLLDNGSDGLVITGSTGEGATLSHREKVDLYRAVVEASGGRGKVIAGTGTYNTAESVELTREAQEAGVDGVLVVTPYYNKPPQAGLVAHFTEVAKATDLPLLLYNIPGRTACTIEADTLLRLAEVANIVGVKDATADFQTASRIIKDAPPDFEVYSGDDWATFPFVCLGAVGVISVASHLVGERMKEMVELIEAGDTAAGRKIHQDLLSLYKALFITSNPIPVKAALQMTGHPVGPPRLPLVPATDDERSRIEQALREVGVL